MNNINQIDLKRNRDEEATSKVNKTIVLTAGGIDALLHARYAWRDDSSASLFNIYGLPASSFSTEN